MIKPKVGSVPQATSSERLITSFIEHWERSWKEAVRYDPSERAMIRAHLYLAVAKRFLDTGGQEVHFTKSELKSAIQSTMAVVKLVGRSYQPEREAGNICAHFVCVRITAWERRDEYSENELVVIRSKLYSDVLDRYRRSGYSDLHVTKREIRKAEEMVEASRVSRERQRRIDEQDRQIRRARQREERQIVRELNRV